MLDDLNQELNEIHKRPLYYELLMKKIEQNSILLKIFL